MNAVLGDQQGGQILVADDDPVVCEALERVLAADGHTVRIATDGREALVLFEADKFDVVIVDYEMPDLKGDELALLIKALAPNQSVIMITAYPEALAVNLLTDVDVVMRKPFDTASLRAATTRLMKHSSRELPLVAASF